MYFSGQSRHFIWQVPLLLYFSFCEWGFNVMYCFVCEMLLSFVIFITSFTLYVKCGPFYFCEPVYTISFWGDKVFNDWAIKLYASAGVQYGFFCRWIILCCIYS
jgi:hypothetical protein